MNWLRKQKAFRWLVYLAVLPLMVADEVWRAAGLAKDTWRALVDQHEAGFRRRQEAAAKAAQPDHEAVMDAVRTKSNELARRALKK